MAIVFDSGDGDGADYLTNDSPTITDVPLTFACWANPNTKTGHDACITLGSNTNNYLFALNLRGDGKMSMEVRDSSARSVATSSGDYVAGSWNHCAGVCASSSSRQAYLDGTGGAIKTTTISPSGVNRLRMGEWTSTWGRPFDGSLAECGVWNVALTDGEIQALANGFTPALIRPESLVSYYPLVRNYIDQFGNNTVTPNNTVVWGEHPISIEDAPVTSRSAWGGI